MSTPPWITWITDEKRQWILAVDFDGTIAAHDSHETLRPGVREMLQRFKADGYRIVVFSGRMTPLWNPHDTPQAEAAHNHIVEYLVQHDIPFDEVDRGRNGKMPFDVLYDDKAVQATNDPVADEKTIRALIDTVKAELEVVRKRLKSEEAGADHKD